MVLAEYESIVVGTCAMVPLVDILKALAKTINGINLVIIVGKNLRNR